jgi:hypothetical protein
MEIKKLEIQRDMAQIELENKREDQKNDENYIKRLELENKHYDLILDGKIRNLEEVK